MVLLKAITLPMWQVDGLLPPHGHYIISYYYTTLFLNCGIPGTEGGLPNANPPAGTEVFMGFPY